MLSLDHKIPSYQQFIVTLLHSPCHHCVLNRERHDNGQSLALRLGTELKTSQPQEFSTIWNLLSGQNFNALNMCFSFNQLRAASSGMFLSRQRFNQLNNGQVFNEISKGHFHVGQIHQGNKVQNQHHYHECQFLLPNRTSK